MPKFTNRNEPAAAKVVDNPKPETQSVEATKVEVTGGAQIFTGDRDRLLERIKPKHPGMVVKWADQEQVRFRHFGWKLLAFTEGGEDIKEVDTMEQAERTTKCVLAWRTIEAERVHTAEDEKRRADFNRFVERDLNPQNRVNELNQVFGFDDKTRFVADN